MKKMFAAAFAVAVMATTVPVLAAEATAPAPIVVHDKLTVTATVEAIDKTNRSVTLKGPKGNLVTLTVDETVTRFDAMKVGDKVNAEYYESVVYELQKPGAAAAPDTITSGAGKLSGEKPGGALTETTVTTVTIRTSDGSIQSFRVRKRKNLEGVKVGDKVQVTQSSALMIAVEPAK